MELTERQQEIQDAIASAFLIAETSESFKNKLSEAPYECIQEFISFKTTEIEVTDVFNLDKQLDIELNELQLEAVAGGENNVNNFNAFISYMKIRFNAA